MRQALEIKKDSRLLCFVTVAFFQRGLAVSACALVVLMPAVLIPLRDIAGTAALACITFGDRA